MENERIQGIKVFRGAIFRLLNSPVYLTELLVGFILAATSPYMLDLFNQTKQIMSAEIFEAFRMGNTYNVGVLAVSSLNAMEGPYYDGILQGVLSGSFAQCMVALIVAKFLSDEFKSGYISIALMRGQTREKIFAKYVAVCVLAAFPMLIIYPAGVGCALALYGKMNFENTAHIVQTLLIQMGMLLGIAVCVAAVTMIIQNNKAVLIVLLGMLVLPLLPAYISVFTKGKVQIENMSLLSKLIQLGDGTIGNISEYVVITIVTAGIFYIIGTLYFKLRDRI